MVGALPSMLYVLYLILSKDPFPLGKERERRGEERRERCYKHTGRTGDGDMVGHGHWRGGWVTVPARNWPPASYQGHCYRVIQLESRDMTAPTELLVPPVLPSLPEPQVAEAGDSPSVPKETENQ